MRNVPTEHSLSSPFTESFVSRTNCDCPAITSLGRTHVKTRSRRLRERTAMDVIFGRRRCFRLHRGYVQNDEGHQ